MSDLYTKEEISRLAEKALLELLEAARLEEGEILVVGCSTSEVQKKTIGSASNEAIGEWILRACRKY